MENEKSEAIVICIDDKGWPSVIPESHRLNVHDECKVLRATTNPHGQTKLILEGFEDLDLVTGGQFDGYSKARFIPKAAIDDIWSKQLNPAIKKVLSKPYDGNK